MNNAEQQRLQALVDAFNKSSKELCVIPLDESMNPFYEIKVLVPKDITDDVEDISVNITFKNKAKCQEFIDKEGVRYVTNYKQEGSFRNGDNEES